jgi:flagellar basal-body rod protein FlgC
VFSAESLSPGAHDPVLREVQGVRLSEVRPDPNPGQRMYEPGHPDADAQGYVEYPNVNVVTEMVNLMTASRAYEAGVTSIESVKSMARAALRIGQ